MTVESILAQIQAWASQIMTWLVTDVLVLSTLVQLIAVLVAFLIARPLGHAIQGRLASFIEERLPDESRREKLALRLSYLAMPLVWLTLVGAVMAVAVASQVDHTLLRVAMSLLGAWIFIQIGTSFIRSQTWSRLVRLIAWSIAALNIVGLLGPTLAVLNQIGMSVGEARITLLSVLQGILMLGLAIWGAGALSGGIERRLNRASDLPPTLRVLFGKMTRVLLFVLAVIVALNTIGVDLTALAVFSSAIGVGLGFGLQKVVSNLISGVILLADKSIKPGDVIALGDTYGWISQLKARYVSVVTRDGVEHLIPNEDLIVNRVENWSFSDTKVRLKVVVGVDYKTDIRKAMMLCEEVALKTPRVLDTPPPRCQLADFGDNAVVLELRLWIMDPENGRGNIMSEVRIGIWDAFHENGIAFPFPQRDLHVKEVPQGLIESLSQLRRGD